MMQLLFSERDVFRLDNDSGRVWILKDNDDDEDEYPVWVEILETVLESTEDKKEK